MIGKLLWLVYKRIRAAFGLAFGFILMYGTYNNVLNYKLFLVATGFMLIHLFGDCYNDYWDYEEDKRNKRKDKLTTSNLLTRGQLHALSFLVVVLGLATLRFTTPYLLFIGFVYALLLWGYSHPFVRLKKYDLMGYALTESPWLFIPPLLDAFFSIPFSKFTLIFGAFFFLQYMYILCQKDSTDLKDATNLFIRRGWRTASVYCIFFALLSSISFFFLSIQNTLLIVWTFNLAAKLINNRMIFTEKIERTSRGRFVLAEFLAPYLYAFGRYL